MLKTIPLVCCECGKAFAPTEKIYYKEDFNVHRYESLPMVCEDCVAAWNAKWQVADAAFRERDYVLTVTLTLADGTVYPDLDAEVLEDTVVTSQDLPDEAKHELYRRYRIWYKERQAMTLHDCFFTKEADGLVARVVTQDGTEYPRIALSLDAESELICTPPVPEYVREQLTNAFNAYVAQEHMLNLRNQPQPRTPASTPQGQYPRSTRRGYVPGKPGGY